MSDERFVEVPESKLRDWARRLRSADRNVEVIEAFVGGVDTVSSRGFGWAAHAQTLAQRVHNGVLGTANEMSTLLGGE